MGAHLYYKLVDDTVENAQRVNEWLNSNDAQAGLEELPERIQPVSFFEEDYYPGIAAGSIKTNSIPAEHYDEAIQLYADVFSALHESKFDVKILTKSCSLRLTTFNLDQILSLTDNGNALSGDGKHDYRAKLRRVQQIRPYPSPFVDTFSETDEMVVSEIPNLNRWKIPDQGLQHRLNDLLRDGRRLRILDVMLSLDERIPASIIANELQMNVELIEEKLGELEQYHLVVEEYGDYRLHPDHELTDDLKEMHSEITSLQVEQ